MDTSFNLLPSGFSPAADSLENFWLACGRILLEELDCFERHPPHTWASPNENPCQSLRNNAMSCLDKSRNWDAWTALLKCRETQLSQVKFKEKAASAPNPISCHEQAAALAVHRERFFDDIITPEVAAWSREMST